MTSDKKGSPGPRRMALAGILLLAAALRCWRLDPVIGGFHCSNEAHYTLIAENFFQSSFLAPTPDGRYLFLETPPLYPYLLHAVFRVTGVSVLAGRLLSVVSSLGLILATFFLTRRLFGEPAGLAAALILAVSPVAVLAGRNIQTDSTFLFFLVAAFLLYFRAEEESSPRDRVLAGALAGLALFTKLFAVVGGLALLLWEAATKRHLAFLRDRGRWLAPAIALALPVAFYGYHAARDFGYLGRDVAGGAAAATAFPSTAGQWGALTAEAIWAFSPVIALFLAAGVAAAFSSFSREKLFVLFPALLFGVFYLKVHKHSYYLLALLPFAAALAGSFVAKVPRWERRASLLLIAVTGIFFTAVDLTSMKLGFAEFAQFGREAAGLAVPHHLLIDREMRDDYGPVLRFYDPKGEPVVLEETPADSKGRLLLPSRDLYLLRFVPPNAQAGPERLYFRTRYGLTLFGRRVLEAHANPHFFRQGRYVVERTGGLFDVGLSEYLGYPALGLLPVPPEVSLYRTASGIEARPNE